MPISIIDRIKGMEELFKHNRKFKKDFREYVELIVTEQFDDRKISIKALKEIRSEVAKRVLGLFEADWWEAQKYK